MGLQSPHMDQMAQEGIRFNRFYSGAPNCAPTRATVMTGRHCNRMGVFNPSWAMRPEELTIAEVLQQAGYATAHFGKWHLGAVKATSPANPHAHGFDHYVSHDNFFETNPELSRNGNEPEKFSGEGSGIIVGEALKYLDDIKDTGQPFFLVIWYGSPHKPHRPDSKYKALYPDLPEDWQDYFGEITGIDASLGQLRAGLESRGLADNTLIWYTSDNGSHNPVETVKGLRGRKGDMWEGGIRVPATIVWPKRITQPLETEMVGSTLDIMPTLLDLLGITIKNRELEGISLLPLLQGTDMRGRSKPMPYWRISGKFADIERQNPPVYPEEQMDGWWRDFELYEHPVARTDPELFTGWAAWIDGKWKLHQNAPGKYELYNLEADPAETTDLVKSHPEVVEELSQKLLDWQRSVDASLAGADYEIEPKLIFELLRWIKAPPAHLIPGVHHSRLP